MTRHNDTIDAMRYSMYVAAGLRLHAQRVRVGFLFTPGSFWVGVHWSKRNRRICLNLLPTLTIWIALRGGYSPAEGYAPDPHKVGKMPELGMPFGLSNYPGAP